MKTKKVYFEYQYSRRMERYQSLSMVVRKEYNKDISYYQRICIGKSNNRWRQMKKSIDRKWMKYYAQMY